MIFLELTIQKFLTRGRIIYFARRKTTTRTENAGNTLSGNGSVYVCEVF